MRNPGTYIVMGYVKALEHTGVPLWSKVMPRDVKPVPSRYMLLWAQEKRPTEQSKDGWDWEVTGVLHLFNINPLGFSDSIPLDNLEGEVITALEKGIKVPNFMVKEIRFESSTDLDFNTDTQSIERRVITYTYWLEQNTPDPDNSVTDLVNAMPPEAEWPTVVGPTPGNLVLNELLYSTQLTFGTQLKIDSPPAGSVSSLLYNTPIIFPTQLKIQ